MRIAIVGAGAIGGWMAARLAAAGHAVSIVARGATYDRLKAEGLTLAMDGASTTVRVAVSDRADFGAQDAVVLAVKGPALAAAAPLAAALTDGDTVIVSAMNGVPWWFFAGAGAPLEAPLESIDPAGAISRLLPPDQVVGCVVHASVGTTGPGQIAHRNGNGLIFGEARGGETPRLAALAGAFSDAGFEVSRSQRIQNDIWYKLWGNMTMNPISALTRATGDRILDDPLVNRFILSIMAEAAEVGERIGCPISESGEDRNRVTRKLGAFRTSMLQDVEAGRPIEVDALLAAPREIAARVQVATPAMDTLHGLTRLMASATGLNP